MTTHSGHSLQLHFTMQIFYFQTLIWRIWTSAYIVLYREQEESRSEIENVRAGMGTFIITSDEDIKSMKHTTLSDI